ncbi:uncharacterized protein BDV17DRAFT_30287 [Aspergillus undulatus]|uniref:uncharacterized protein n=1 Tax=Aspergillus undulatus TaxID=1810928 RepID=UPI003CCDD91A
MAASVAGAGSSTTLTDRATVTLERSRRGHCRAVGHRALRNNLLAGVGFLELANAGDFAANVWNEIPVPRHAMILMAIGGPIALLFSLVAARDFYLSRKNVSLLYSERQALKSVPDSDEKTSAVLGVNFRELGTEVIDRMLVDLFLGVGALLVGTGTIMAIWGANHRVFNASNLLSGFIGNGFAALYGVFNAFWSGYLVYRLHVRYAACLSDPTVQSIRPKLRQRFRRFQWHAGINGLNGIVAGMASMVTAKMWWGYVVLIPCIIVMIAGNLFWKWKLGYDRPVNVDLLDGLLAGEKSTTDYDGLDNVLDSLAALEAGRIRLREFVNAMSLETSLSFIEEHQMLEYFCPWIARRWPSHPLFVEDKTVKISCEELKGGSVDERTRMGDECQLFLRREAAVLLEHRERYLLELVGEFVWRSSKDDGALHSQRTTCWTGLSVHDI